MDTKHIKQILVLICCVTLCFSGVAVNTACVFAETEPAIAEQGTDASQEIQPEQEVQSVMTAAQKKAARKAKKRAATKKNRNKIVRFAKKQVGKKYRYGGKGPKSFDCIGIVYYVFKNSKAKLKSAMTEDKSDHLKTSFNKYIVSHNAKKAKAGDIVIFYKGNHVRHACIAIGNGRCVNASKSGVKTKRIPHYSGCKVGVIRLVK